MKSKQVFERVEKKYLLDEEQYKMLRERIRPYMQEDEYGLSAICNIYYDTEYYDLIRHSLDRPAYKEKFRVRSYGIPNEESKVYLEIKKKYKGIVYKRRESMSLREANDYLQKGIHPNKDSQILREIDYFLKKYQPNPKLYLAYDRIALFGIYDSEIRMTFDTGIRSRKTDLSFMAGDWGEYLFPDNMHLLEIKVSDAMPLWMTNTLSELSIYPVSFSKYGSIYAKDVMQAQSNQKNLRNENTKTEDTKCLQVLLNQGT